MKNKKPVIKTYKTKPKTIQAIQWNGKADRFFEIQKFIKNSDFEIYYDVNDTDVPNRLCLSLKTYNNGISVYVGDYVLKKEFNYITVTNRAFLDRDYELVKNETI